MASANLFRTFCIFSFVSFFSYGQAANYKVKLFSIEKCKIPENRLFKNAPLEYTVSAKKISRSTAVIKAVISITKREGPIFTTFRGYQVAQTGSKDLIFNLQHMKCNQALTKTVLELVQMKVDKDCYSIPGNYSSENINIEIFQSIFTKTIIGPGRYAYEVDFFTSKGIAACVSVVCDMNEIRK